MNETKHQIEDFLNHLSAHANERTGKTRIAALYSLASQIDLSWQHRFALLQLLLATLTDDTEETANFLNRLGINSFAGRPLAELLHLVAKDVKASMAIQEKVEDYWDETTLAVGKVLARLRDVELVSPGYWRARCPVCDNGTKLTVVEGEDERAMVECDDGCWLSTLLSELGLSLDDLLNAPDDVYIGTEGPAYPPPDGFPFGGKMTSSPPNNDRATTSEP